MPVKIYKWLIYNKQVQNLHRKPSTICRNTMNAIMFLPNDVGVLGNEFICPLSPYITQTTPKYYRIYKLTVYDKPQLQTYFACSPDLLFDSSSMQELSMQEHKQQIYKTCSCCGRDTWRIELKQILQTPKYLIIIVNRITYSNNRITENKSRMPLGLYIKLCPY